MHDAGTVFRMTKAGSLSVVYSFAGATNGSTDGAEPYAELVQGDDGNFYGTTYYGGASGTERDRGSGTVFRLTPAGVETVVHSFAQTGDGMWPRTLIRGSDGNFYGLTDIGGVTTDGVHGTVYRITPAGEESVLYSFTDESDGGLPNGLIEATPGTFYGATAVGGAHDEGAVFMLQIGID